MIIRLTVQVLDYPPASSLTHLKIVMLTLLAIILLIIVMPMPSPRFIMIFMTFGITNPRLDKVAFIRLVIDKDKDKRAGMRLGKVTFDRLVIEQIKIKII